MGAVDGTGGREVTQQRHEDLGEACPGLRHRYGRPGEVRQACFPLRPYSADHCRWHDRQAGRAQANFGPASQPYVRRRQGGAKELWRRRTKNGLGSFFHEGFERGRVFFFFFFFFFSSDDLILLPISYVRLVLLLSWVPTPREPQLIWAFSLLGPPRARVVSRFHSSPM